MADLSDVMSTLQGVLNGIVYPNGTGQPSITDVPVIIEQGWPDAGTLDTDLANLNNNVVGGRIHLSIYPRHEERVSTRYKDVLYPLTFVAPTVVLTINGQTVTLSGTISTPQNVAIVTSTAAYLYAVQANDTLASIATALAALIPGASSSGAVITVPNLTILTGARAGGSGTMYREHKRQTRSFQLTIWANNDANRSALASQVDVALSAIEFIQLPDGTAGRLLYQSSPEMDTRAQVNLFRRDLFYTVEYATVQVFNGTQPVTNTLEFAVVLPDGSTPNLITRYQ